MLVEAAPVSVGDEVFFTGPTTGVAEQRVEAHSAVGDEGRPALAGRAGRAVLRPHAGGRAPGRQTLQDGGGGGNPPGTATMGDAPRYDDAPAWDGVPMPGGSGPLRPAVACGVGLAVLDGTIANVALPTIARELEISPRIRSRIVNAYQLAIMVTLLTFSALGDIARLPPGLYERPGALHPSRP